MTLAGDLQADIARAGFRIGAQIDVRNLQRSQRRHRKILKEEMPGITVVMLTIADDDDILFQAIKNGAKGYLLKNMEPQELYHMLNKIRQGEPAISGAMASKILREFATPSLNETKQHKVDKLTAREIEVLEEIVKGVRNKEIAGKLNIAENAVKVHLRNILEKLHLHNRTQVAVHAVRKGLVSYPAGHSA